MEKLTVKEAVERVSNGGDFKGVVLDKESLLQVNVRDAMILSRGGIVVPEENLYYDDNDIEYDEEIDELIIGDEITHVSWEEKSKRFEEFGNMKSASIDITTDDNEIEKWIEGNRSKLGEILKPIIVNLFNAEKVIKNSSPNNA